VTTHKTYYGTHGGHFLGVAPTHRKIHFETAEGGSSLCYLQGRNHRSGTRHRSPRHHLRSP
jgi:hypothetical protein